MKSVWTTEFRVRSYESDRTGTLKPHSLLNYFEEVAQQHATELGFGYEQLKEQQQFWVLSRLEAVVNRSPRWGEKVTVETWPKSVSRLFAIRDFLIHDGQEETGEGQPLVRATSAWLLMDARAGRPLRPEEFLPEGPLLDNSANSAVDEVPGRIPFEAEQTRSIGKDPFLSGEVCTVEQTHGSRRRSRRNLQLRRQERSRTAIG